MQPKLEALEYEEFWVMMLSRSNRVKYIRCVSQGGTAATMVDVKLLLKRAIDCLAEADNPCPQSSIGQYGAEH